MSMGWWHQLCTNALSTTGMGKGKINGDVKPFNKAESYFANVTFFMEDVTLKEIIPAAISSTRKRGSSSG